MHTIEANKRVNSRGIESIELLGTVSPKDVKKIIAAAKRVPLQQCQMYVITVASELEKRGFLQNGTTSRLGQRVQMSQTAQGYRRQNPVAKPSIAWYPAGQPAPSWVPNVTTMPASSRPSQSSSRRADHRRTTTHGSGSQHAPQVIELRPTGQRYHSSSQRPERHRQESSSGGCCIVM